MHSSSSLVAISAINLLEIVRLGFPYIVSGEVTTRISTGDYGTDGRNRSNEVEGVEFESSEESKLLVRCFDRVSLCRAILVQGTERVRRKCPGNRGGKRSFHYRNALDLDSSKDA